MNLVERLHQRRAKHSEKGMASLMYILLILVVCAALGMGIDTSIGTFTSNGLRSIADMSVMDASSKTELQGNTQSINQARAKSVFLLRYNEARKAYPNVTAKTPSGARSVNYIFDTNRRTGVTQGMTVSLIEVSHTRFLALVGITEFKHDIESSARLGALYERR